MLLKICRNKHCEEVSYSTYRGCRHTKRVQTKSEVSARDLEEFWWGRACCTVACVMFWCAVQLRVWPSKSADEQQLLVSNEESIVYSQAIHYANRMVYLRVPLDATKKIREPATGMEGESQSSMVTNRSLTSSSYTRWAVKKCATLFWTITPMFLGGFLHFLYQREEEWIIYGGVTKFSTLPQL